MLVVLTLLALLWAGTRLPLREALGGLLERAEALGPWGAPLVASLFVPCSLLLIPGTPVGVFTGFAFDLGPALLSVILFSNLGAQAAFLLGRSLFRVRVLAWVARDRRRQAVERAVSGQGLRMVVLLRLTPLVPFNALNYVLSVSRVRFRDYALGTFLGMLPGTMLNVWAANALGQAGRRWSEAELETGLAGQVFLALRIVLAVVAVVLVTRRARTLLAAEMGPDEAPA